MGLCEIADEDMMGEPAKQQGILTEEFQEFGYYHDQNGKKHFGVLPSYRKKSIEEFTTEEHKYGFRWIDSMGNPRYDSRYDIDDIHDLE